MKRYYKLSHRYRLIASILLISLFLQSCGSSFNQLIPQAEESAEGTLKAIKSIDINPLVGKELTASGGDLVTFCEDNGELKENVKVDEKQPTPNYEGVPVLVEEGADVVNLTKLDPKTQQGRIELNRSHSGQLSHITIRKGELSGGMKKKKKNKPNKKRNEKSKGNNQQVKNHDKGKKKENQGGKVQEKKKKEEEKIENFCYPNLQELYSCSSNYEILSESEINSLIKKGLALKSNSSNHPQNLQQVVNILKEAAQNDSSIAMYHIGLICEEHKIYDLAVRWYVLSFQHNWLKDPANSYSSLAYNRLLKLQDNNEKACSFLKRVQLLYPSNVDTPAKKFGRLHALIEFYKKGTSEPYLNKEETKLKIGRLRKITDLIKKFHYEDCLTADEACRVGAEFMEGNHFQEAEKHFLNNPSFPFALYSLGLLYEEGHIEKEGNEPNYEKAAELYKQAATTKSLCKLGKLYVNGLIGKIDDMPDYQAAIECFELSGTAESSESLGLLGLMFYEGKVGKIDDQPDYQKAKECFERSDTPGGHLFLGTLYREGYIGDNAPQPDYEKAKFFYRKAADGGNIIACLYLGYLYMTGNKPNYTLAISSFEKITSSKNESIGDNLKAEACRQLGSIYKKIFLSDNHRKRAYQKANDYYKKAIQYYQKINSSDAFYHIGYLYEMGHIEPTLSKSDKQKNNYKEALKYYNKSSTPDAFYRIGYLYETDCIRATPSGRGEQNSKYEKASEYYNKSNTPDALYRIGYLYRMGYIRAISSESSEQKINYEKALEYYEKSESVEAKLDMLWLLLHQPEYIELNSSEKNQQKINKSIDGLNRLLPSLSNSEQNYVKGLAEYYIGNLEDALVSLQQALLFGSKHKGLDELIETIISYLEPEESSSEQLSGVADKKEENNIEARIEITQQLDEKLIQEGTSDVSKGSSKPKKTKNLAIAPTIKVETKKELKKERQTPRRQVEFLKLSRKNTKKVPRITVSNLVFVVSQNDEEEFKNFIEDLQSKEGGNKLKAILEDIKYKPWATEGDGKPEVLKNLYRGIKGCISRRLNGNDRFVYKVIERAKIHITGWKGHYSRSKSPSGKYITVNEILDEFVSKMQKRIK